MLTPNSTDADADELLMHRAKVARRLLSRGIGAQTLTMILPDWKDVVAAAECLPDPEPPAAGREVD